jgi:hypothetical protein
VVVLCAMGAALALPGVAAADRAYSIRFTANAQGDITGTGNTLMTCDEDRDVRCPAARNGQGGSANNNNGIAMRYVDIDADARTFDSSAATLSLPAGARGCSPASTTAGGCRPASAAERRPRPRCAIASCCARRTSATTCP